MFLSQKKRIFLDHASGTAIDTDVLGEMNTYFCDSFYNPSALYTEGVAARGIIESSRASVARDLKARSSEIYFMNGGTEANNVAIVGVIRSWQRNHTHQIPHIITSAIEHSSVLETYKSLEKEGVLVTYLPVDDNGVIDIKELKKNINLNTVLISIGYVNGEIGTIQDIRSIMKTVRHFRKEHNSTYPLVHTDAVQAVNYVETIGVPQLGIDLMTMNASKIYGPKMIAVLFVKTGLTLDPILFGGNQERGLRSGTENVPYIVGMARSLSLARKMQYSESLRLEKLQSFFLEQLRKNFDCIINAEHAIKIPNIVNISFQNISHEEIVIRLDAKGIMASVKSACKAGDDGDSHVIMALAEGKRRPTGSIRFSMGRETTRKDLEKVVNELKDIVEGMNDTYKKYYVI